MSLRIAVAQISSESNHFVPGLAGLDFFRTTGYLLEGPELLDLGRSDTEVGGFLSILQSEEQVEVVPLIAARANSGNPLSAGCYRSLKGRLIEGLRRKQPVQGVLLSCHGSMGVQGLDDPEGDLAAALRKIVGPRAPLALTLDLHGNLTQVPWFNRRISWSVTIPTPTGTPSRRVNVRPGCCCGQPGPEPTGHGPGPIAPDSDQLQRLHRR